MPLEHASWIIPAAKEAYEHREDLQTIWDKILTYLLGKKSLIGITGMAGAGKSVLLEYLTGDAYQRGHPLPEQPSPDVEEGKMTARKKRIRLMTIPGQDNQKRYDATVKLFEGRSPITGVVHVVANGFATIRQKPAAWPSRRSSNSTPSKRIGSTCWLKRSPICGGRASW